MLFDQLRKVTYLDFCNLNLHEAVSNVSNGYRIKYGYRKTSIERRVPIERCSQIDAGGLEVEFRWLLDLQQNVGLK